MKRSRLRQRIGFGSGRSRRGGAILVVALVCLLVVVSLVGTMMHSALTSRRQLPRERERRQAELLVQAGIDRALYRLAGDPQYRGETWLLGEGEESGPAEVTIDLTQKAPLGAWHLTVVAEYPRGSEQSVRRSRELELSLDITSDQE